MSTDVTVQVRDCVCVCVCVCVSEGLGVWVCGCVDFSLTSFIDNVSIIVHSCMLATNVS